MNLIKKFSIFNLILLILALLIPIVFIPEEHQIRINIDSLNCTSIINIDLLGVPTIQGTNDPCVFFGI